MHVDQTVALTAVIAALLGVLVTAALTPPFAVKRWIFGGAGLVAAGGIALLLVNPIDPLADPSVDSESPGLVQTGPTERLPSPSTSDAAIISAQSDVSGGCSNIIHLNGEIRTPLSNGYSIWIVAQLNGEPTGDRPNALLYPKMRTEVTLGSFTIDIPANKSPGFRSGYFLLVSADASGDAELQRSMAADQANDRQIVPDGHRVRLPPGTREIARTDKFEQRC